MGQGVRETEGNLGRHRKSQPRGVPLSQLSGPLGVEGWLQIRWFPLPCPVHTSRVPALPTTARKPAEGLSRGQPAFSISYPLSPPSAAETLGQAASRHCLVPCTPPPHGILPDGHPPFEPRESARVSSLPAIRRKYIHFQPAGNTLTGATAVGVERLQGRNDSPAPSCCGRRN